MVTSVWSLPKWAGAKVLREKTMCTGIKLKTKDDSIGHGRTVEFGITIYTTIAVVPRDYQFVGQTPLGDGLKYAAR